MTSTTAFLLPHIAVPETTCRDRSFSSEDVDEKKTPKIGLESSYSAGAF